jgi:hypothetical protein
MNVGAGAGLDPPSPKAFAGGERPPPNITLEELGDLAERVDPGGAVRQPLGRRPERLREVEKDHSLAELFHFAVHLPSIVKSPRRDKAERKRPPHEQLT